MDDFRKYRHNKSKAMNGNDAASYSPGVSKNPFDDDADSVNSSSFDAASSRQYDPATDYGSVPGYSQEEDSDEDEITQTAQKISQIKQQSLNSTRNALSTVRQTEDVGAHTMDQLGEQGEQLNRVERTVDVANIHAKQAVDKTGKLRTLNKSIFHVHVKNPFSKKKRREQELVRLQAEQEEDRIRKDRLQHDRFESQKRVENSKKGLALNRDNIDESGAENPILGRNKKNLSEAERQRYTFDSEEDPEIEDEINDNLNDISDAVTGLKKLALNMNQELTNQNDRISRIQDQTESTADKIGVSHFQLNKIK